MSISSDSACRCSRWCVSLVSALAVVGLGARLPAPGADGTTRRSARSTVATSRPVRHARHPAAVLRAPAPLAADRRAWRSPSSPPCRSGSGRCCGRRRCGSPSALLIGANIWMGNNLLGTVHGWQAYWAGEQRHRAAHSRSGGQPLRPGRHEAAARSVVRSALCRSTTCSSRRSSRSPTRWSRRSSGSHSTPRSACAWGFDNATLGLGDLLVYGAVRDGGSQGVRADRRRASPSGSS